MLNIKRKEKFREQHARIDPIEWEELKHFDYRKLLRLFFRIGRSR